MRIRDCNFADDVLYHVGSNTWVKLSGGLATVGVNTVVAWAFGVFSSVTLKSPGSQVLRGGSLGSIEGPKHFDVIRSPLSGELVKVNPELTHAPKLLNKDPYGAGWLVSVRPSSYAEEAGELKAVGSAAPDLAKTLADLKVRCFLEFPDFEMYEIGTECSAVLAKLDEQLKLQPSGVVAHLVSDDQSAGIEMIAWSERTGNFLVEERKEGSLQHFIIRKR